jgi:hypothetical protein
MTESTEDRDRSTEVLDVASELVHSFGAGDVASYFSYFDPSASFIFYTTPGRLESRAAYEAEWRTWERDSSFRVLSCESANQRVQMFGDVAIFSHDVSTVVSTTAGEESMSERETIVFQRSSDGWTAVHEHLSPNPS